MDRRHPHTVIHELMVSGVGRLGSADLSLSAGKGFAAFGSDDPANRLTLRYPVNHHWSQILERAVLTGGARVGPVMAEASLFNGDEPEYPEQSPNVSRFGDSWSARLTVFPVQGLQVEASYADGAFARSTGRVPVSTSTSGTRQGSGPDRWPVIRSTPWWNGRETEEGNGLFVFHSVLAEASWTLGATQLYYQFERTERPEEERILDQPTRSVRPHLENSILGTTRWTLQHRRDRAGPARGRRRVPPASVRGGVVRLGRQQRPRGVRRRDLVPGHRFLGIEPRRHGRSGAHRVHAHDGALWGGGRRSGAGRAITSALRAGP